MNKRLVWNFEISDNPLLDISKLPVTATSELNWEARYFWKEDTIITLHGLSDDYLNTAIYTIKERRDVYYLLPEVDYNIKLRRDNLLYKPLMQTKSGCRGFIKKINLSDKDPNEVLPSTNNTTTKALNHFIQDKGIQIPTSKTALVYKFPTNPIVKLELARVRVDEVFFYSLCIEGHSAKLVSQIAQHLAPQENSTDYIRFLKEQYHHDR